MSDLENDPDKETPIKRGRGRPKGTFKIPAGVRNKVREGGGKNGGARKAAGRPKGSKNIHSHESVKKLQDLKFDPIEMMVTEYKEISKIISSGEVRVGSGAHAQLIATKAQLINNLMQYGYKKIPEKTELETSNKKPLTVTLSLPKSNLNE